jgi:hypothetical protein
VRKILPVILVVFGLAGLTLSAALAQGSQVQTAPTPLEKAVAALGGAEALEQLSGFTLAARGVRWLPDEGLTPSGKADMIGPFEVQITYDLRGYIPG